MNLVVLVLDWPFYNFKNSKPNKLASPFRRRKKKTFSYLLSSQYSSLFNPIAGSCACHSPCRNPCSIGKDEFAGAASIEGSGTPIPTPVMSLASNPAPTTAPAVAPTSDNELFKQFIKAYLEAQVAGQIEVDSKPCEQPLKPRFPDLYYVNLHIDCYRFCQQCEDHI